MSGALELLNYVDFLITGRYRSLLLRLLQVRLLPISAGQKRFLDFELFNRTLLWNTLSEFLEVTLRVLARLLGPVFRSLQDVLRQSKFKNLVLFAPFLQQLNADRQQDFAQQQCQKCAQNYPTMQQTLECGCVYCFYCIKSDIDAQRFAHSQQPEAPKCPRCETRLSAADATRFE